MARKKESPRQYELVFIRIYDVGRSVDFALVEVDGKSDPSRGGRKASSARRDTPESLSLPQPLIMDLEVPSAEFPGGLFATAKIYEDGAVTICIRVGARVRLGELRAVASGSLIRSPRGELTLGACSDSLFDGVLSRIRRAIVDPASDPGHETETYLAYCLLDCAEGPDAFIANNRVAVASLLVDAESGESLHEQKIAETLSSPFSYTTADLAIFDLDRCFIVAPPDGYEDILQIIEHANYRLLELRVLDRLLDKRLDEAERVLGSFSGRGRASAESVRKKFARIQALRFVALFVLENLENSSKIIGDYYLGQIYERLCAIFNTDGWGRSVARRLDVLTSVYEMVKTDNAERRTLALEIVFIAVCIILPLVQIAQALL